MEPIFVTSPFMPRKETYLKYLDRIYQSRWLTNFGPLYEELEQRLKAFLGLENLLIVNSGASAEKVILHVFGIQKKVLTTPFSFVGSVTPLLLNNNPVEFCDISRTDLNIDADAAVQCLQTDSEIEAVLPVHVFGVPVDVEKLQACGKKIIYDASHAFGVKIKGRSLLEFGDASFVSLHATKVFSSVEGGLIVFKDPQYVKAAKEFINFGMNSNKDIVCVGDNYKISELHCAFALAQLDEWDEYMQKRQAHFVYYEQRLPNYMTKLTGQFFGNFSYYPVLFKAEEDLLESMQKLSDLRIYPRRYFYPSLNSLNFYKSTTHCPIAEDVSTRILCLPLAAELDRNRIDAMITLIAPHVGAV